MHSHLDGSTALRTERLHMRPLARADVDALHEISNDRLVRRYLWANEPVSTEQMEELVDASEALFMEARIGLFGVRLHGNDALVGFCGFLRLEGLAEPEIACELSPDLWDRGLATEAGRACMRYAFRNTRMDRVIAGANPRNVASMAIMRKLGMVPIGNINPYLPADPYFALYRDLFERIASVSGTRICT